MVKNESLVEIFHELKNPISTIKVNIELLKEYEQKERLKSIDVIENEINKIDKCIRRYLSFTDKKSIDKDYIYFSEVIESIIDESAITYPDVQFQLEQTSDEFILAYEYHIYMIFSNIIKNAIEAINGVGKIDIRIKNIDGLAQIEILDDGNGITTSQLKKINEGFFTTKPNGNGLGTAIIKNAVEIYNGEFNLINRAQYDNMQGTVAVVRIPV